MPQLLTPQNVSAIVDDFIVRDAIVQAIKGTSIATVRAAIAPKISPAALAFFDAIATQFGS